MTGSPGGEAGPLGQPLLREPGAFWGGVVAGAPGLDLREEPLMIWQTLSAKIFTNFKARNNCWDPIICWGRRGGGGRAGGLFAATAH